jgi:hypothetical protein
MNVRETMIDLLGFLKYLYIGGNGMINNIEPINDEQRKEWVNVIEKILSNDVILVSKNKLERSFKEVPVAIDKNNAFVFEKNYKLSNQIRLAPYEYNEYSSTERFKKYLDEMLTNGLVNYFISDVGFTDYDKN